MDKHCNKHNIKKIIRQGVCTRIAPSPTGALHIGTARTALFNFLFARHNRGKFYLRIEDTDIERSKPEFEKDIIENLKWLGLEWDGKILKQSQRRKIYVKYIKKLLDSGRAFWCFHTKEELEEEKKDLLADSSINRRRSTVYLSLCAPGNLCPSEEIFTVGRRRNGQKNTS